MKFSLKEIFYLLLISLVPVFFLWLPFLMRLDQFWYLPIKEPGMFNIVRNWDGPNYIVVAKTFYDPIEIGKYFILNYGSLYYTVHLPFYPIFIFLLAPLFGWLYSGVMVTVLFGVALNFLFYYIAREYTKHPLWLTFVFTVFPARFLITRGIIAPETLMLTLVLLSFFFWGKKKYLGAAITASLAFLTKVQTVFLFPAFLIDAWLKVRKEKADWKKFLPILIIPLTVLGLCTFYYFRVGDFFAFLKAQESNKLSLALPFMQFDYTNSWVSTGWVEDIVLYIVGMFVLVFSLSKVKEKSWFYFVLLYTLFLLTIPQRDITRLSYPLLPLFLFRFQEFFTSKVFKWALIVSLPAIYMYALNFLLTNQAPVVNWTPLIAP